MKVGKGRIIMSLAQHANKFRMIALWKGTHWRICDREITSDLYEAYAGEEENEPRYRELISLLQQPWEQMKNLSSNMGATSHMHYINVK